MKMVSLVFGTGCDFLTLKKSRVFKVFQSDFFEVFAEMFHVLLLINRVRHWGKIDKEYIEPFFQPKVSMLETIGKDN